MKSLSPLFTALFLILTLSFGPLSLLQEEKADASTLDLSKVYREVVQSVVKIESTFETAEIEDNSRRGSGLIISKDGYILTAAHVVSRPPTKIFTEPGGESIEIPDPTQSILSSFPALTINILLNDGRSFVAKPILVDRFHDVAVLKIKAPGLKPAELADYGAVKPGQPVFVVGSPGGAGGIALIDSITSGIVSAKGRSVWEPAFVFGAEGELIYEDNIFWPSLFQLDAGVNRGNSGGPIFDSKGKVIGIAVASLGEAAKENLNFGVPISLAKIIFKKAKEKEALPWLGALAISLSKQEAEDFLDVRIGKKQGVVVIFIYPDGPATNLHPGDIVEKINGKTLHSAVELDDLILKKRPGDKVRLKVNRGEEEDVSVVVRLGKLPTVKK